MPSLIKGVTLKKFLEPKYRKKCTVKLSGKSTKSKRSGALTFALVKQKSKNFESTKSFCVVSTELNVNKTLELLLVIAKLIQEKYGSKKKFTK